MLLIDKGYYDHDYEKVEKPIIWEQTVKSDEEVADMLATFGMGPKVHKKPRSIEEIQEYIIREETNNG